MLLRQPKVIMNVSELVLTTCSTASKCAVNGKKMNTEENLLSKSQYCLEDARKQQGKDIQIRCCFRDTKVR